MSYASKEHVSRQSLFSEENLFKCSEVRYENKICHLSPIDGENLGRNAHIELFPSGKDVKERVSLRKSTHS